jgi:polyhydroxyalkanoate synthase subunit PhaC
VTTTLDVELAEAGDLAGAPLDLLLTDAVKGNWQRFAPDTTVLRTAGRLANRPRKLLGRVGGLAGELGRVAAGRSRLEPDAKDRRFADQAWSQNWLLHRVLRAYLATRRTAEALVEDARLSEQDRLRMMTLVSNVADVLAPSNNPLLNPLALKAVVDTGGANFVRGVRRLAQDLSEPPRVPRMIEPDAFTVGKTVAATPGAVIYRDEVCELIQYTPSTEKVRTVPLLIVPPTINKYYLVDVSPGRSLVEYLVGQGHQVFTISWRNPDVRHSRWGFDTYGATIVAAINIVRTVTHAPSAALLSLCSGGILSSMVLAHLAHLGELDKVAAHALSVAVLDQREAGVPSALLTQQAADAAVRASAARGYLDGRTLAEVFAWLRPNDLVWNYWVQSYLLGTAPKPFDMLFWNADPTRMAARLHRDFIHLAQRNSLTRPDAVSMLGSPVDLSRVHLDGYITAGIADHLCPWQKCYQSTQLFGGRSRFVLSTSGHIASIVNPPGNKKANYRTADHNPADASAWLAAAEQHEGSWWPDFSSWLHARTGELVTAPTQLGDHDHPVLSEAPGTYVYIR